MCDNIKEHFDSLKIDIREIRRELFQIKTLIDSSAFQNSQFEALMDNQTAVIKLRISKKTLYTLRQNGTLPYTKLQNKILYKISDLQCIIDNNYVRAKINQREKSHV